MRPEPPGAGPADAVDLREHLATLRRRKWVIITSLVLAIVIAVGVTARQTPLYQASTEVLLRGDGVERRFDPNGGLEDVDNRIDNELELMESGLVRDEVASSLGRPVRADAVAVGSTDVVRITVSSEDPERAAEGANRYAETYVQLKREQMIDELTRAQTTVQEEVGTLEAELAELEAPIRELEVSLLLAASDGERDQIRSELADIEARSAARRSALQTTLALYQSDLSSLQVSQRVMRTGGVQLISEATVPAQPVSPDPVRNGALGVVGGLVLGIGLAFGLEVLDDRVRSKEELERLTGWPAVGFIPSVRGGDADRRLPTLDDPRSPPAEAFRGLRTAVQFVGLQQTLDVIQVTSPRPGDGKTTTAANLAAALALTGKRVVLLDADLRRPRVHRQFGISNARGFTSMLLDDTDDASMRHHTDVAGLVVIPSGPPPPNPSELLGLPAARAAIERIASGCDVVVIDSPPLLAVTDALVLSNMVHGVLVVTRAGSTRSDELVQARGLLEQAGAPVIGVCVNEVDVDHGYGSGYGYEIEDVEQPAARRSRTRRPRRLRSPRAARPST